MLSEACLLDGAAAAGVDVRSLCVGNWRSLFLPMETRYVSFTPGRLAAVCLTNHPPFFAHFAATIRHDALDSLSADHSRLTYIYFFQAKPRFAAALLEPIMNSRLKREVRGRLHALRSFFEGARL